MQYREPASDDRTEFAGNHHYNDYDQLMSGGYSSDDRYADDFRSVTVVYYL